MWLCPPDQGCVDTKPSQNTSQNSTWSNRKFTQMTKYFEIHSPSRPMFLVSGVVHGISHFLKGCWTPWPSRHIQPLQNPGNYREHPGTIRSYAESAVNHFSKNNFEHRPRLEHNKRVVFLNIVYIIVYKQRILKVRAAIRRVIILRPVLVLGRTDNLEFLASRFQFPLLD